VLLAELGEDVTPHQDDFHGRCLRGTRAVAELGEDGLGDGLRVGRERIQMQWSPIALHTPLESFFTSHSEIGSAFFSFAPLSQSEVVSKVPVIAAPLLSSTKWPRLRTTSQETTMWS
jgi:hypothetical protein